MEVLTKQTVEGTVATVSGKIDAMTAQALESSLSTLIKKGILCMVPYLGGENYIGSARLRVIHASVKSLCCKTRTLLPAKISGAFKVVFDISGFG